VSAEINENRPFAAPRLALDARDGVSGCRT